MSKTIMEWCEYNKKPLYLNNVTKELYENMYKGELTCIEGCEAKIKFTERKNGFKFFSTWNKEGTKHNKDCPFYVKYTGKGGRKRLKEDNENSLNKISEQQIENSIKRKFEDLKKEYKKDTKEEKTKSTYYIENTGDKKVSTLIDEENNVDNTVKQYITSVNAEFINSTYLGLRKRVIGYISNAKYEYDNNKIYGYLNLRNEGHNVSAYFPEAFFNDETQVSDTNFKRFIDIVSHEIYAKKNKLTVVCFGEIKNKKKDKKAFNINIIKEPHFLINEMSFNAILNNGYIKKFEIAKNICTSK